MATRRRRQFVSGQVAWMASVMIVLTAIGSLSLELFFVVSLIGLLIVTELTAPLNVTPRWRKRLRVIIVLGLLAFAYIVVRRIMEILGGVL